MIPAVKTDERECCAVRSEFQIEGALGVASLGEPAISQALATGHIRECPNLAPPLQGHARGAGASSRGE